jgi:hypothetical protein
MTRSVRLLFPFVLLMAARPALARAPSDGASGAGSGKTASARDAAGASSAELATADASADPGLDDGAVRRAQSHFQRGVELYQEQDYGGALAEFTRAQELAPNYRILYNLAQTQAERHDYVAAVKLFDAYLNKGADELSEARRQGAERERTNLMARIATVLIDSNVDDAELFVDGQTRGLTSRHRVILLNPGPSQLRLEKRGYEPVTRELTLTGGDSVAIALTTQPISDHDASSRNASLGSPEHSRPRTELWVSAAATGVLAGATVTFAVLTAVANRDLDAELGRLQDDTPRLDDARSRVKTFAALTDGFGVATVLGLSSVLYFLLSNDASPAPSREQARVDHDLRLALTGSGVALVGGF